MSRYLDLVNERVVVFDGATGTNLQELDLAADDYGGPEFEGGADPVSVKRPDGPRRGRRLHRDAVRKLVWGDGAFPWGKRASGGELHGDGALDADGAGG